MYGWRAKIGLITPMCETIEHAFHIHAPEGVSFASTKVALSDDPEVLKRHLEAAAALYKDYDVDLLFLGLPGLDPACIRLAEEACGRPVADADTAVLHALEALEAKKVAVLPADAGEGERQFLESAGFEVSSVTIMDISYVLAKGCGPEACDEYLLYRNALKAELKGADVFYLSGLELTSMELVGDLETVLGVPVVTGQQAALWSALRRCRVGSKAEHLGKLFQI